MAVSRRDALKVSGVALAGLAIDLRSGPLLAQAQSAPQAAPPDHLIDAAPLRPGFPAPLALNPDGSAKHFTAKEMAEITDPPMWRYTKGQTPDVEADYRKLRIKVDGGGATKRTGTLTFADLAPLPKQSQIVMIQCGAPNPHGIVKWTGVRFSDVAKLLGVQPYANYCRFVGADRYYTDEDIRTLMHPQTMLVWMMNDQPLPAKHGAPIRLVIPFRYGARSMKSITEIRFASVGLATQPLPG